MIILSLYGGSAAEKEKKKVVDYYSLGGHWHKCVDGLGLNDFLGRSFQSLMVLGRNEYCWYWVLQCGCENC